MKSLYSEDDERIARHRTEREGWGFVTIEQQRDIEHLLDKCEHKASFLLDSLTALLANEMFLPDGTIQEKAAEKISRGLKQVTDNIQNIVIVSDYIYSDAYIYDELTDKYRKSLAELDRRTVESSDIVLEAAYTNIIVHKGKEQFEKLFSSPY
jgi:adenosylcobinamide kinase/adenosylcobinamide-phosphate guanylyltransferase